jgi:hypothetical protein
MREHFLNSIRHLIFINTVINESRGGCKLPIHHIQQFRRVSTTKLARRQCQRTLPLNRESAYRCQERFAVALWLLQSWILFRSREVGRHLLARFVGRSWLASACHMSYTAKSEGWVVYGCFCFGLDVWWPVRGWGRSRWEVLVGCIGHR